MSLKMLANRYIELNVHDVRDLNGEEIIESNDQCPNYTFIYCRSGEVEISIDNVKYRLEEGEIAYCPINHHIRVEKGNYSCIWIVFNGTSVDELIHNSKFFNNVKIKDDDTHLGYYFYKIYHAYHECNYLSIKCLGVLYELFFELTKKNKEDYLENSNQEKHIQIAKDFINDNYQQEITISDVAKEVGVTSNYLANIFANYLHTTPKGYLTMVRMEQAKILLCTNKYKIKDVGMKVGYKNQLHFSGEFKKYTGVSPLEYAKSNRN